MTRTDTIQMDLDTKKTLAELTTPTETEVKEAKRRWVNVDY